MADLTSNQLCNICCIHYNAGLRCCSLGSLLEGGYLFARQGGLAWIVACSSREVNRVWTSRGDAVTVANASDACGDWFVPSGSDLELGYVCNVHWDYWNPNPSAVYWSSLEFNATQASLIVFNSGRTYAAVNKTNAHRARAFRRIFY